MSDAGPAPAAPTTARARARVELTREIKATARRQLCEVGAAGLSLRAVARELGMVSSAIYRYFPSRDELLTALIVDAYDAVGEAAERAAADTRGGVEKRYGAVAAAIRGWAVANPHEYALVYGSPVPGYAAPVDTVTPAARVALAALQVVADGVAAGEVSVEADGPVPRPVHADFQRLRDEAGLDLPDPVLGRVLVAWTATFGTISFELFGHFENVVEAYDEVFAHQIRQLARYVVAGTVP